MTLKNTLTILFLVLISGCTTYTNTNQPFTDNSKNIDREKMVKLIIIKQDRYRPTALIRKIRPLVNTQQDIEKPINKQNKKILARPEPIFIPAGEYLLHGECLKSNNKRIKLYFKFISGKTYQPECSISSRSGKSIYWIFSIKEVL